MDEPDGTKSLYILQLQNDCWYVGTTKNLDRRLTQHREQTKECAAWIKVHPVVEVFKTRLCKDVLDEDSTTKKLMLKHGIDKVRGGSYVQVKLPQEQLDALNREFRTALDKCLICGETKHPYKKCATKKTRKQRCCSRCGRNTHDIRKCFANTHLNGAALDNSSRARNNRPVERVVVDNPSESIVTSKAYARPVERVAVECTTELTKNLEERRGNETETTQESGCLIC